MALFKLDNVIQNYAWGSKSALTEMFGIANPQQQPQAEIWMGHTPMVVPRCMVRASRWRIFWRRMANAIWGSIRQQDLPNCRFCSKFYPLRHRCRFRFTPISAMRKSDLNAKINKELR